RPDGMALKPWWFRTTSHSCRCRRAHPNSTARKTSGSSCVRIGCQTGFSNPSTISSTTAATLGTHSSTNPGRLCPSRDAIGQQSVTQSEDWYNMTLRATLGAIILIDGTLASAAASATTIMFSGFDANGTPVMTYAEGGFTVTTNGPFVQAQFVGNPAPSLAVGPAGGTVDVTSNGGGLFDL